MTGFAHIIKLIEDAPGPSRDLDAEIWAALDGTTTKITEHGGHEHTRWTRNDVRWPAAMTHFTSSLDCALRLFDEMLPDYYWYLCRGKLSPSEPLYGASTRHKDSDPDDDGVITEHENGAALALVLVMLKTLDVPRYSRSQLRRLKVQGGA